VEAIVELEGGKRYALVVEFQSAGGAPMSGLVAGCSEPEPPDLLDRGGRRGPRV